ncbi:MAG: 6-bladed beta-propeller, partial [Dysgonamonadaceae bacterium]|nr:6-bladed beta-propeller [Dysgonamonadaceae bacterium]
MKKQIIFFIFFIFIAIVSCNNKQKKAVSNRNITPIYLDNLVEKSFFYPSDQIDGCRFVPLETSDSCLLSWIEKIIFANNLIFIFDGNLDKIFVFDMFGKFQNEIGQIGQGPDELLSVCGFYVNEEKKYVGVLDILKHKIFRYSFDG